MLVRRRLDSRDMQQHAHHIISLQVRVCARKWPNIIMFFMCFFQLTGLSRSPRRPQLLERQRANADKKQTLYKQKNLQMDGTKKTSSGPYLSKYFFPIYQVSCIPARSRPPCRPCLSFIVAQEQLRASARCWRVISPPRTDRRLKKNNSEDQRSTVETPPQHKIYICTTCGEWS